MTDSLFVCCCTHSLLVGFWVFTKVLGFVPTSLVRGLFLGKPLVLAFWVHSFQGFGFRTHLLLLPVCIREAATSFRVSGFQFWVSTPATPLNTAVFAPGQVMPGILSGISHRYSSAGFGLSHLRTPFRE